MDGNDQRTDGEARRLVRKLRESRVTAPPTLLPAVLARVGLGDSYAPLDTAIGPLYVAYNNTGISAVVEAQDTLEFERRFRERFGRAICRVERLPAALAHEIHRQIAGEAAKLQFDLRSLTPFEQAVLQKAREIPRGEVRPYAWVAREIGRPKAVRAVGNVLAHNPTPLLIPCHRVVHSDGHLGNYIFGGDKKRTALEAEGAAPEIIEALGRAGVRYFAHTHDGSFCLPTCGGEHRRTAPDRILFHSERDVLAAGFRPCRDCRPLGPM
jgi:O-6-methylguanine DNA methyltransferase